MRSPAPHCVALSPSGNRFAVLHDADIHVYNTSTFGLVQRMPVEPHLESISELVTHVRLYSDAHLLLQTFDGAITVVNFHEGKTAYQHQEDSAVAALDNDLLLVGRNVAFARRNRVFLLRRLSGDSLQV